jgi:hypothetical protein
MQRSLAQQCIEELSGTFALNFAGIGAIYHLGTAPAGGVAGLRYGRCFLKP